MSIILILIILTTVLFNIIYAQDVRDASAESYVARASEILQRDRKQIESLRLKQIKEMDLREKTKEYEARQQKLDPYKITSSELENRHQQDKEKISKEESEKVKEAILQKVKAKEEKEHEKQLKQEKEQDEADDTFRKWLKTKGPLRSVLKT
jgi:hypothetical protein